MVATLIYASIGGIGMCRGTPRMVCMVAKQDLAIPSWIKTLTTKWTNGNCDSSALCLKITINIITYQERFYGWCRNPNIRFTTKCEVQGPMRARVYLGVKHTFTNGGKCKGWSPMTPKCTPTLGVALVRELWMFKTLIGEAKKMPHLAPMTSLERSSSVDAWSVFALFI